MLEKCLICNKTYNKINSAKTCSDACSAVLYLKRRAEKKSYIANRIHTCEHCGTKFKGRKRKYCHTCKQTYSSWYVETYLKDNDKTCLVCGKEFVSVYGTITCSDKCREIRIKKKNAEYYEEITKPARSFKKRNTGEAHN